MPAINNIDAFLHTIADIPLALRERRGVEFRGHVVYPDAHVGVPASAVDGEFVERLGSLIRRLASDTPARKVPSAGECRFCNITAEDCPERVEGESREEGMTDDF